MKDRFYQPSYFGMNVWIQHLGVLNFFVGVHRLQSTPRGLNATEAGSRAGVV
jgi:hypothetical protein